ncbi:hypothetical protein H0A66_08555 [Alcaligenaceae bacterium]|nr:hypothetical protein [Alcaligenaceae bacterium]
MKTYRAIKAFPHGNSHVGSGALVRLTDKQAAYLVPGGFVELEDEQVDAPVLADAPQPADAPKKGAKK